MRFLRIAAWVCFILIITFCGWQDVHINKVTPYNIMKLEFVNNSDGKALLRDWSKTTVFGSTLLHNAELNTIVDCFFIICYVAILFMISYHEMQKQSSVALNSLLRLSLMLAVCVGILDYIENFILFYNFRYFFYSEYISSFWCSLIKFLVAAWVIIIWLTSIFIRNLKVRMSL